MKESYISGRLRFMRAMRSSMLSATPKVDDDCEAGDAVVVVVAETEEEDAPGGGVMLELRRLRFAPGRSLPAVEAMGSDDVAVVEVIIVWSVRGAASRATTSRNGEYPVRAHRPLASHGVTGRNRLD